jgi:hypothetical protein
LSLGTASDAVRDQVLRHDPNTRVFSGAYRDELLDSICKTLSSRAISLTIGRLTRAFTHMSIRYNPGAPKKVPEEVMKLFFVADPDIVDLE